MVPNSESCKAGMLSQSRRIAEPAGLIVVKADVLGDGPGEAMAEAAACPAGSARNDHIQLAHFIEKRKFHKAI